MLSTIESPPPVATRGVAEDFWNAAPCLLAAVDDDSRLQAVNPAWRTLLGYSASQVEGRSFGDFVHPDDAGMLLSELDGTATEREVFVRLRHGRDQGWRAFALLLVSRSGETFAIGRPLGSDASDEAAARAGLQQARHLQAIGRLCGGMSHEFNNLLQSLRHALELIRRHPGEPLRVRTLAESALRLIGGGSRMTAQLMDFAGLQSGPQRPVRVADLAALREPLQRRLGPAVFVSFEGLHDAGWVMAEPRRLQNAILNLAANAGEAMPSGGRLVLRCERVNLERDPELPSGAYLKFSVTDEGAGMNSAVRERAFEPFFTTKPIGAGPGLGLAQVYGFAHYSGGSVRLGAARRGGTTVTLLLPAIAAPEDRRYPHMSTEPAI
jgi:PAS domain S-box-containing protein